MATRLLRLSMVSPDVEDREEESAKHRSGDDTADDDADDERIGGQ